MGAADGVPENRPSSSPPSPTRVFFPHVSPRKSIHDSSSPSYSDSFNYGENLRITVCANQGGRKYMEDRVHIHCERGENGILQYTYVAVYDGHGGAEASVFTKEHLLNYIIQQKGFDSKDDQQILEAIRFGFLETHQAMEKVVDEWPRTASGFRSTSGTTASVAFIMNSKVYTGHVGDSAVIVGYKPTGSDSLVGRSVTIDHKPDSPVELSRIENAGGRVQNKAGVMRVVWTRAVRGHYGPVRRSTPQESIPFLAVARSLGDLWSYNESLKEYVVSPVPDLDVFQLTNEHKCLVLGSDGLWNVIKPQFSVDIVNAHEWKEIQDDQMLLDRPCHENHSRWLTRHCLRGWGNLRADNVTTITVIFDPPQATLPPTSECLIRSCSDSAIELELTENPEAMIRVTNHETQVLKTGPVELLYSGSMDLPAGHALNGSVPHSSKHGLIAGTSFALYTHPRMNTFSGPGFSRFFLESCNYRRLQSEAAIRPQPSSPGGGDRSEPEDNPKQKTLFQYFQKKNAETEKKVDIIVCPYVSSVESHSIVKFTLNGGSPKTSTGLKQKTYFCTKHGEKCVDTRTNKNDEEEEKVEEEKIVCSKSAGKPRYNCKKHGLDCKKVKEMNKLAKDQNKDISNNINNLEKDVEPFNCGPPKCHMSLRSTPQKHVNGLKTKINEKLDSPLSPKSILSAPRSTRSGVPLSPSKSAPLPRGTVRRMRGHNETPRGKPDVRQRVVANKKVCSVLNADVRKSCHLFRVRRLRYCLRRPLAEGKLISHKGRRSYSLRSCRNGSSLLSQTLSTPKKTNQKDCLVLSSSASKIDKLICTNEGSPQLNNNRCSLVDKTPTTTTAQSTGRKRRHCSDGKRTLDVGFKKFKAWKPIVL